MPSFHSIFLESRDLVRGKKKKINQIKVVCCLISVATIKKAQWLPPRMTFSHLFPLIHWQHWDKKTQRRQDRCENTKNHSSAAFLRAATGNWLRKVQMENTFRLSAASHFLCSRSLYLLSQWKYLWVQYIYIFWHAGFCLFDVLFIKRCVCFASVYALNSSSFFFHFCIGTAWNNYLFILSTSPKNVWEEK